MEKAASALDWHIQKYWPEIKSVCICCGSGNNGGDGLLLAFKLSQRGILARVILSKPPKPDSDAFIAFDICNKAALQIEDYKSVVERPINSALIVDAMLGSGFVGTLSPEFYPLFDAINSNDSPVLSVDVPSGVNVDSGNMDNDLHVIWATHTLTFGGYKPGMVTGRANEAVGELFLDEIDLSRCLKKHMPTALLYSQPKTRVTKRPAFAHKGKMGNVVLIGGNAEMGGAIMLATMASAAMGVGYVRCATHSINRTAMLSQAPEILISDWPEFNGNLELEGRGVPPDALVLGPGLGLSLISQKIYSDTVSYLIQNKVPSVVDADALALLAEKPEFCDHWILTPHPKEAARLLGDCSVEEVESDRQTAARHIQQRYGGVCILKGSGSLVYGDTTCTVNRSGNSGMARAGMGDVLSGILGGLLARNPTGSLYDNACLGTWMHGKAGDLTRQNKHQESMQASDLVTALDQVWQFIDFN